MTTLPDGMAMFKAMRVWILSKNRDSGHHSHCECR